MGEENLEVSCRQVQEELAAGTILLVDCREAAEYETASIAGARLLPMSEIQARLPELRGLEDTEIVVHCHHGMRSLQVAQWLRGQGFSKARSMAGGIDCWSLEVDPTVPRY